MAGTTKAAVDESTQQMFTALALGRAEVLNEASDLRGMLRESSGLGPRTFAMVKIAALVAIDAPPASYMWQVGEALEAGVTPRDILGILAAVAPQVGMPRVLAAAPEIMVALDMALPGEMDI
jgi:4-carboxymuconolactone decarboxylase